MPEICRKLIEKGILSKLGAASESLGAALFLLLHIQPEFQIAPGWPMYKKI